MKLSINPGQPKSNIVDIKTVPCNTMFVVLKGTDEERYGMKVICYDIKYVIWFINDGDSPIHLVRFKDIRHPYTEVEFVEQKTQFILEV